jgi:hypothetical protein
MGGSEAVRTSDEAAVAAVDVGFVGAALKMNSSAVDGDLRGEQDEVELRPVAREMRRRGDFYRGER